MNNAVFITVRTTSARLPNKALLKIDGITTIEYLIQRLKYVKNAEKIILCTTENTEDDVLVEIAKKNNIFYFRGSEHDKLMRWKGAAEKFDIVFFVTADGDDLFCEPSLIDLAFEQFKRNNADFIQSQGIITGAFTYGIKVEALKKVCEIKNSDDTEMMWVYFTDTGIFKVEELSGVPDRFYRNDIRMTLDYQEDLDFFREVVRLSKSLTKYISLDEILMILEKHSEVKEINFFRQAEWANNQKKKISLKLKEKN